MGNGGLSEAAPSKTIPLTAFVSTWCFFTCVAHTTRHRRDSLLLSEWRVTTADLEVEHTEWAEVAMVGNDINDNKGRGPAVEICTFPSPPSLWLPLPLFQSIRRPVPPFQITLHLHRHFTTTNLFNQLTIT